ncbi:MAG: Adaptive-response sensory-kinase SasA [Chlamydiia bacterium]|nr:Adaptive-response sensory-kinase SasA [Chlamydiia bacterium]MCH9615711.1 Adaptive-response sensory-kinase SasA [Chlamydiia bacterium]MCH9628886.1 Adaptive-response sensory-kinase SasA [Chlamydiia bacterium]
MNEKYSVELFQSVFDHAPDATLIIDSDGDIILANHQSINLFGYSHDELIHSKVESLIPERFRKAHINHRAVFIKNPHFREMGVGRTLFGLKKDGTEFPIEVSLSPIQMGKYRLVAASIRDVSVVKAQEMQLLKRKQETERFLFVASHDLQEPLQNFTQAISFIEEELKTFKNEPILTYLEVAKRSCERMSSLIKDLLQASEIGRDQTFGSVDLTSILNAAIEYLKESILAANAEVIILKPLPTVFGFKSDLQTLFRNLIRNSLKYKRENVPLKVEIDWEDSGEEFTIHYKDNGVGIEQSYLEKIFDLFFTLHSKSASSSNGIGLWQCKRIIELHQGGIWAQSKIGEGTSFFFTIRKNL